MLPVEAEPMVSVWLFVVPSTPSPDRYVALSPLFAEIEAVGVPSATFKNPNFALLVELAPRSRSAMLLYSFAGLTALSTTFQ